MAGGEGREGDWECKGCKNRNYGFRTFCNRCKHPRLLVDTSSSTSSWLPRLGDWICSGCTNNNYASRDKCKKCGQPKEVAAMPAFSLPGVLATSQGAMNMIVGANAYQPTLGMYGVNNMNTPCGVSGWRSGDWMCSCGFHNYSSRTQCKQCNAAAPALGVKRVATDEPLHDWESKRLNAGAGTSKYQYNMQSYGPMDGFIGGQKAGLYHTFPSGCASVSSSMQGHAPLPHLLAAPTPIGKGAQQWREGDWVCSNCNNHNYASRSECNRCKTQKTVNNEQVSVT